jgi:spore coat protein U-like protein
VKYIGHYQAIILTACCLYGIADADTKTATVNISATLLPTCAIGSGSPGTLDFGTRVILNQTVSASGTAAGNGGISIACNQGIAYKVVLGAGNNSSSTSLRYMIKSATGERIGYNLFVDSARTTVWDNQTGVTQTANGNQQLMPVYGLVYAQSTPSAGLYQDTVVVTVTW